MDLHIQVSRQAAHCASTVRSLLVSFLNIVTQTILLKGTIDFYINFFNSSLLLKCIVTELSLTEKLSNANKQ